MQDTFQIAVLPGDGIGPEVTQEAVKVLCAVDAAGDVSFKFQYGLLGGSALIATATPLPAETLSLCTKSQAILLGAVGGPQWDQRRAEERPEYGLLQLRKRLGLYMNLRPARVLDSLLTLSALKPQHGPRHGPGNRSGTDGRDLFRQSARHLFSER